MVSISARVASISLVAAFAVAVLGGSFFGLFLSGGYAWHWPAFQLLSVVVLSIALIFWQPHRHRFLASLGLVTAFVAIFLLVEALTAPVLFAKAIFSGDYWKLALNTLLRGPC